jgi:hypothetical protein
MQQQLIPCHFGKEPLATHAELHANAAASCEKRRKTPFICWEKACPARLSTLEHVQSHACTIHTMDYELACECCPRLFRQLPALTQHEFWVHDSIEIYEEDLRTARYPFVADALWSHISTSRRHLRLRRSTRNKHEMTQVSIAINGNPGSMDGQRDPRYGASFIG